MRRLADDEGRPWDAVVSRESWGALYALFVPAGAGRGEPIRRALLRSEGYDQAQRELDRLPEDELLLLFRSARPTETT